MPQFARPVADSVDGNWTDQAGGTSLFAAIDEPSFSDADYIQSGPDPVADVVRIHLGSFTDPLVSTGYTLRYRIGLSGSGVISLTVRLKQGSTVIASWVHDDVSSVPTTITQTLSGAQADAITDPTDLYLEFEPSKRGYAWTDMGADSVINANADFFSRYIRTLTPYQGVIWIGSGSINATSGTTYSRYFDPADTTFKYGGGRSGGEATDGLTHHFVNGTDLYVPYRDPAGAVTADYLKFTSPTSGTLKDTSQILLEHGFGMCRHGSDLYLCGGTTGMTWEATVWRSTDSGANWSVAYQPGVGNRNWFLHIFSYGGYLWVTGYDAAVGESGNTFKSSDGTTWTDAGFQIRPSTLGAANTPLKSYPFAGYQFIHSGVPETTGGQFLRFDGSGSAPNINNAIGAGSAYDICLGNGAIYVLKGQNIFRSFDGIVFDLIASVPVAVYSIAVVGTDLYCGTGSNSKIYKGVLA